jgi:hypothetical protein
MEILVHISAPTTRQDDDHFRAQALAYLEFEPCRTASIIESEGIDERQEECVVNSTLQDIFRTSTAKNLEASPSPSFKRPLDSVHPVEQADNDLYGSFPSVTSLSNCSQEQTSLNGGSQPDPSKASVLQRSKDLMEQLEFIQTLRKPQQRLSASGALRPSPRTKGRPTNAAEFDSILFYEESQLAAAALQSQLSDSPSFSFESELAPSNANRESPKPLHFSPENPLTSRIRKDNENNFRSLNISPNLPNSSEQPASFGLNSSISTTLMGEPDMMHSTPNPSCEVGSSQSLEKQFMVGEDVINCSTSIKRSQLGLGMGHKQDAERQPSSGEDVIDPEMNESYQITKGTSSGAMSFLSIPLEVLPPGPRISDFTPTSWPSQSTKALDMLRDAPENVGRFKPLWTTRNLAMDERGHWQIETANWEQKLQYTFWYDLANFVRRGYAGWGVTLHREPPNPENENNGNGDGLGQVQLYSWGELIEHTYLLLWLYSNGKVRGSSLQWIDSADAVIVQMP